MVYRKHYNYTLFYFLFLTAGFVSIDALQFGLTSALTADPPEFILFCVSTGGPATTVTWTRDGAAATGVTSQTVTSSLTATYFNTLTVTGRLPGNYQCSVTNDRSTAVRTLTVQGIITYIVYILMVMSHYAGGVAPSGVSAAQDGTTVTVTWIPPSPAPSAGYMVYYSTTGDEGSVSVSSGSDSQAVITGRQADRAYTVSVVAVFYLPSVQTAAVPAVRPGTHRDTICIFVFADWSFLDFAINIFMVGHIPDFLLVQAAQMQMPDRGSQDLNFRVNIFAD